MKYPEVEKEVKKILLLRDYKVVKFMLAVMVANKIPQLKPTFAMIVGNSSGGKSTLLDGFRSFPQAYFLDDITPNTFISGAKRVDKETSLLLRVAANTVFVVSDLTMLLSKDEKVIPTIMSQLRLMYDGKLTKEFGTGDKVVFNSRVGFLAGVTDAIYQKQQQFQNLGERMLYYSLDTDNGIQARIDIGEMALNDALNDSDKENNLQYCYRELLNSVIIPEDMQPLPQEVRSNIIKLAEMATRARSAVTRKQFHRDNPITQIHDLEGAPRMAKQLMNIGQACKLINGGELLPEDTTIMYKAALDSIPRMRKIVMERMASHAEADMYGLARDINLHVDTIKPIIEDLHALGVIKKSPGFGKDNWFYEIEPYYRELFNKFLNIETVNDKLTASDKEPTLQIGDAFPELTGVPISDGFAFSS